VVVSGTIFAKWRASVALSKAFDVTKGYLRDGRSGDDAIGAHKRMLAPVGCFALSAFWFGVAGRNAVADASGGSSVWHDDFVWSHYPLA